MTPPGEKIIETKKCRLSGREFPVTDKDLEFYDKVSPILGGKKYIIPSPTLCPEEREKRRLLWRNDRKLYKRKCDKSGKEIISMFAPDKDICVYENTLWFSDAWSPYEFARDMDFSLPAFSNFHSLLKVVPNISLSGIDNQNSPYVNHSAWNKNCHLIFYSDHNDGCQYLDNSFHNKDSRDSSFIMRSELCYGCYSCLDSYHLFCSKNCHHCQDSFFLEECSNCVHCFGCVGLHNKEYHCFNEPLTKEEYEARVYSLSFTSYTDITRTQDLVRQKLSSFPRRYYSGNKNFDFSGDYLSENEHVYNSFNVEKSRNCNYVFESQNCRDCMDINGWGGSGLELGYEGFSLGDGTYHAAFCDTIFGGQKQAFYSQWCGSGENVFFCSGVRHGKNVILNKPYSNEEYEDLARKIVDHMISTKEWGEFFPHELSPYGYNETVAQEYFPMTEEAVKARGWKWYDTSEKSFDSSVVQPLPIREYDERQVGYDLAQKNIDYLLAGVVQCILTKRPFKIIKQELAFYIEHHLPIPTKHPNQRHKERMDMRNPRMLYERACAQCQKPIITTYAPERPEKILCEECYRKLVY